MENPTTDDLIGRIEILAGQLLDERADIHSTIQGINGACLRLCGAKSCDETAPLSEAQTGRIMKLLQKLQDPYLQKRLCDVLEARSQAGVAKSFEAQREKPDWNTRAPLSSGVPLSKRLEQQLEKENPNKTSGKPGSTGNPKKQIRRA